MPDNPYPLAWAALAAAGIALEVKALRRHRPPSTLSSQVWSVLHYADERSPLLANTGRVAIFAGLTLLGSHFAFEWPK